MLTPYQQYLLLILAGNIIFFAWLGKSGLLEFMFGSLLSSGRKKIIR